jgi:hypothetical protein
MEHYECCCCQPSSHLKSDNCRHEHWAGKATNGASIYVSLPVVLLLMLREAFDGPVHLTSSPSGHEALGRVPITIRYGTSTDTEAQSADLIHGACGADHNADPGPIWPDRNATLDSVIVP